MVYLVLSSSKGNQGLKYFPHTGYLGLTPVRVEGLVRTKFDGDAKQLRAKSLTISVRCYEARVGRVSVLHSSVLVDYTQVLWSKPDGQDYALIDELEYPFRITVPAQVGGFSTATYVDYRCTWRVEAVLTHAHIPGVGTRQIKHFELPLVRFDTPSYAQFLPHPSKPLLLQQTTKPKAPRMRYAIHSPTTPIGPMDIISVPIYLLPMDHSVSIRTATVMIERRIVINETATQHTPPDTPYIPVPSKSSPRTISASSSPSSHISIPSPSEKDPSHTTFDRLATIASDSSSNPTITNDSSPSLSSLASDARPLLPSSHPNSSTPQPSSPYPQSKVVIDPVVGAESSGYFSRDEKGLWTKTITLQWPAAKPQSRWTIGETIHSELVSVRFFARVKINVSSPNGSEYLELSEKELLIVSTNEAQRQIAVEKYNELMHNYQSDKSGRSKSKSPRRTPKDLDHDPPPSPFPFKPTNKQTISAGSVVGSQNGPSKNVKVKMASPRRPHTSAGPRDNKTPDFSAVQARLMFRTATPDSKESSGSSIVTVRPKSSQGSPKRKSGVGGFFSSTTPKISTAVSASSSTDTTTTSASGGSGSMTRSTSSMSSQELDMDVDKEARIREWEAILAKVESDSRKSSFKLGFFGRRERSAGLARKGS